MDQKFYFIQAGWATRYYWLDIVEEELASPNMPPFEELIKSGKITFTKQKGTSPADAFGGTIAEDFFSQKVIDILKENKFQTFKEYPLKINKELNIPYQVYYLDILSKIRKIDRKKFECKNMDFLDKTKILVISEKTLGDLNAWDGSDIFTVENTRFIIITQKVKDVLVKAKLKNIQFEEIKKLS